LHKRNENRNNDKNGERKKMIISLQNKKIDEQPKQQEGTAKKVYIQPRKLEEQKKKQKTVQTNVQNKQTSKSTIKRYQMQQNEVQLIKKKI